MQCNISRADQQGGPAQGGMSGGKPGCMCLSAGCQGSVSAVTWVYMAKYRRPGSVSAVPECSWPSTGGQALSRHFLGVRGQVQAARLSRLFPGCAGLGINGHGGH